MSNNNTIISTNEINVLESKVMSFFTLSKAQQIRAQTRQTVREITKMESNLLLAGHKHIWSIQQHNDLMKKMETLWSKIGNQKEALNKKCNCPTASDKEKRTYQMLVKSSDVIIIFLKQLDYMLSARRPKEENATTAVTIKKPSKKTVSSSQA